MRHLIFIYLTLHLFTSDIYAQNLSGQWKGSFNEYKNDDAIEYILELEVKGRSVEGTSITYFTLRGKKYYTMCAVTGSYDPDAKTIVSKEVSKIKANTPDWFRDCFQTHTLTYFKKGEDEQLSGNWKSAKREDNCGRGTTLLTRKNLIKKQPVLQNQTIAHQEKNNSSAKTKEPDTETNKDWKTNNRNVETETAKQIPDQASDKTIQKTQHKFEKRSNKVFETFELNEEDIYVSIYDNAEIDGDVITVIYNGEIVLSNQTLSDQPISFRLKVKKGMENILTMYAENQGKVPPNTAIMRIQNGKEYYKILLSADDKENASVIFKAKE